MNIEMAVADSTSFEQRLPRVVSAQFRRPLLHLILSTQNRHEYLTQCVPLHKAALRGNWKEAWEFINRDSTLLRTAIAKGWGTVLHIAAGANQVHFVEELLKLMTPDDLELQDMKGNTAFCFAAAVGNVQIAEMMLTNNQLLATIRGGGGLTPLQLAVLQGRAEMAKYLFPMTTEVLEDSEWQTLFLNCINSGLYDLALDMLKEKEKLAFTARGDNNETGLHVLARNALICGCKSQRSRRHLLHFCKKDSSILKLTKRMWDIFLYQLEDSEMIEAIRDPTQVTFIAAQVGNSEFLSVVLSTYPDLIWELDNMGRSVIHVAVLHRHASIFNLIHEIGPIKDFIVMFTDDDQNNLLHSAAKLPPRDRLHIVSGAALQMMLELSWFEEVKKIVVPSYIEMPNLKGDTPRQLFSREHEELQKKAESWMERTADSCMVVSTLIATGVFSAAFSVPGGNNDSTGSPNYMQRPMFLAFALSDAVALISSSTSILIFLSIRISRYAEDDFLRSLPLKLMSGLLALFISIITMMVAFSSAFFIAYYHGLKWVPGFISSLAFLPIPLFIFLQFPLWSDILYSAYICGSLFRPSKRMIH